MSKLKVLALALWSALAASACSVPWNVDFIHDARSVDDLQVIGILPFQNLTQFVNAGDAVADIFYTELNAIKRFRVIAPSSMLGMIERGQKILPPVIDRSYCHFIGQELKLDAVMYGSVQEYSYRRKEIASGSIEPAICISMRLVSTYSGTVIWSSTRSLSSREAFTMQRDPITHVAQKVVQGMVEELKDVL